MMTHDDQGTSLAEVTQRAESVFGLKLEGIAVLRDGRATVIRAISHRGPSAREVVIKRFKAPNMDHYLRERTGLSVLADMPNLEGFVPELVAADDGSTTLVIESIPESESYAALVAAGRSASARVLTDTAWRLGALHGGARSGISELSSKAPAQPSPGTFLRGAAPATLELIERVLASGGARAFPLERVESELMDVADQVDQEGPLSTVTLGDLAPSNVLLGLRGPVFIDLEFCGVRGAFYDAMYWHCIYPFPSEMADEMDRAYSAGLQSAGINLTPNEFALTMHSFMSQRLFWTLSWNLQGLLERDREVGDGGSMRSAVRRYLHEYCRVADSLPRVAHPTLLSVAREVCSALSRLWRETAVGP
jgi:hypothetical protein